MHELSMIHDGRFASGLLDPDAPVPGGVSAHSGKATMKRYAVYRNNVTSSLVKALENIFPATRNAIGDDGFRFAAITFVRHHPPASPLLFRYGEGFDGHLMRIVELRDRPWLADLARLERAWLDAYHAADAIPLRPETLAAMDPEKLADIVLRPHPATRIIKSNHAVVSLYARAKEGRAAEPALGLPAHAALVTRPQLAVNVAALDHGQQVFFSALIEGLPLGEAAGIATDADPAFDTGAAIGALILSGAFADPARQPAHRSIQENTP